ncbi:hypothetical protein AJ79_03908 [Helicocarpus griseus UAMH5409]|uniref:Trafficking protein particle complex subunit n=1 Tax=Helicocarpus griseus UAMH5409 TaxID=1447875 RepID=A0A2B7XWC5_9EURO|nr:hypothetical protein AJ79_03908 [Helicocarpus griseus UAMH5409]
MSTANTSANHSSKREKKSHDYTLTRVRNNQRRCRERRRQYIATLEQKVEENERLLAEARAEIASLKSQLIECRARHAHLPEPSSVSVNSAAVTVSSGERSEDEDGSGNENESPVLSAVAGEDSYGGSLINSAFYQQLTHNDTDNILSPPTLPEEISSEQYPSLTSAILSQADMLDGNPFDAIIPETWAGPTLPASLSAISSPTPSALRLQDLTLPTTPSNCYYANSPDDESTTLCSQAFVFITQQNFKGVDISVIERWLSRGFRQAKNPGEGCRVENSLLFQFMEFASVWGRRGWKGATTCTSGQVRSGGYVSSPAQLLTSPAICPRVVYSLIIINKAGGLIYHREFQSGLLKLSTNDYLVLAGTFHGIHAITRSLTPRLPTLHPAAPGTSTPTSSGATPTPSTATTAASHHHHTSSLSASARTSSPIPFPASTANSTLPNPSLPATGLEVLETEKFRLTCFQTVTGTKFLLFTDPLMAGVDVVMKQIYELYADYVMKNPFYQMEMPVRCEAFDRHLGGWVKGR